MHIATWIQGFVGSTGGEGRGARARSLEATFICTASDLCQVVSLGVGLGVVFYALRQSKDDVVPFHFRRYTGHSSIGVLL